MDDPRPGRHPAPNVPRALPPRLDPDEPGPDNALYRRLNAAVDQYGFSPPTLTKSRRHGHVPNARQHVQNYLLHSVFGQSIRSIAQTTGRAPSTVAASIKRGRTLVQEGADTRGFMDPDPPTVESSDPWALD